MHRVLNYGSILQAYATQYVIEQLGFNCEIIDYQYPNSWQFERGTKYFPLTWKNKIAKLLGMSPMWRRRNKLDKFIKQYMRLSPPYNSPESLEKAAPQYDIYMTGSDQVWNPYHTKGDPSFFLHFAKGKRKVAYAASFAKNSLHEEYKPIYRNLLKDYQSISVRETGGCRIVKELIDRDVPVVLDPTLLLTGEQWGEFVDKIMKKDGYKNWKYILVYMLNYAVDPSPVIYKIIEKIQKETGLPVISIGKLDDRKIKKYKKIEDAGIFEFLQLFRNASYVVTSSFHGTAFAVNFGKPFYSIIGIDGDERQSTLLKQLGLQQCVLRINEDIDKLIIKKSYNLQNENLIFLRKKSIEYLYKILI